MDRKEFLFALAGLVVAPKLLKGKKKAKKKKVKVELCGRLDGTHFTGDQCNVEIQYVNTFAIKERCVTLKGDVEFTLGKHPDVEVGKLYSLHLWTKRTSMDQANKNIMYQGEVSVVSTEARINSPVLGESTFFIEFVEAPDMSRIRWAIMEAQQDALEHELIMHSDKYPEMFTERKGL